MTLAGLEPVQVAVDLQVGLLGRLSAIETGDYTRATRSRVLGFGVRSPLFRSGLLLATVGLLIAHALVFDFVNDDAFISFRYADNLVEHGALVFNPGEKVEGYTNFLWTVLMAGVLALGLDVVVWSKILGIALGAGSLWAIARFTAKSEGPSAWDALGPLLLALAPAYACWSTGGLETQLFTFTATMGWTGYLRERDPDWSGLPTSGIWFGLSAMTRPEGMLLFGLTGLHRLSEMLFVQRTFKPEKQDWIWGFGFALTFGPYYLWRYLYYGYPFPNTYYVKTGAKNFWAPGWRYFWSWVTTHALWLFVPLAVAVRRSLPRGQSGRLLSLVALYTVGVSLHVIRVGGDFMALHRFLVPLMPALAVVAALSLRTVAEGLVARGQKPVALWVGAAVLVAAMGAQAWRTDQKALEVGSDRGVDSIGWLKMFAGQCADIGRWIAENTPEDTRLATTAAGTIPFYARRYTYDILLLNVDTEVVKATPAHGNRPGHTKAANLKQILAADIDYLIYHPTITERRPGKRKGEKAGWKRRGYEWFTVKVPGMSPPWWGVWRRP